MEKFQVPGIFKHHICYARHLDRDKYEVFMDTDLVGIIDKEGNGWFLDQYINEILSSENVQLIGQFINKRLL